ncbi:hypothetical protein [Rhizobium leguminosarum]|uniref:hypothetical protein n=1 Tax=Rhizobium leguminosarum TaxID=384 RepID=UPI0013D9B976|nr:hypothetical protein [Rhizobium leguminosarum]NEK37394.1 hypothetical protein [Rhizobium leguminosarum]
MKNSPGIKTKSVFPAASVLKRPILKVILCSNIGRSRHSMSGPGWSVNVPSGILRLALTMSILQRACALVERFSLTVYLSNVRTDHLGLFEFSPFPADQKTQLISTLPAAWGSSPSAAAK